MSAVALKGLVINTANEAGPADGPDYMFGWGLLNATGAANLITLDDDSAIMQRCLVEEDGLHQFGGDTAVYRDAGVDEFLQGIIPFQHNEGTGVAGRKVIDGSQQLGQQRFDAGLTQGTTQAGRPPSPFQPTANFGLEGDGRGDEDDEKGGPHDPIEGGQGQEEGGYQGEEHEQQATAQQEGGPAA